MTHSTLDYDPSDTGEIPRPIGETARIISAADRERLIGENTENLGQYARPDAPFPHLRQVIEIADTVQFGLPQSIKLDLGELRATIDGDLAGPQSPQPSLPEPPRPPVPPKYDMAADTELPEPLRALLRPEVPRDERARFEVRRMFRAGRHAAPATFAAGVLFGALMVAAVYSGLVLAAVAVIR